MKKLFWFLAVISITASSAFAQLTSSSLIGTVAGPDGGLVPGATVVLKSNVTGTEVTRISSAEGAFRFPNLDVGSYTVTITAEGFKTFSANDIKIEVNKDFNLAAGLEIGAIGEVVNVTVGEEIINSVDGQINNNISRKQLDDLPSLGRNPLNFVPLQPGAANVPGQGTSINGIRTSGTNTTLDGVNIQDNFIRSNATDFSPARPTVDEIEEFSLTTQANASGGFGGAQIQFATRRGGNDYHFRLFEFNRNSSLAANSFFNNAAGVFDANSSAVRNGLANVGDPINPRPFRNRNQFGGSASGPLPFFNFGEGGPFGISGRDKLFFFFSYEKLIDISPAAPQFSTVLTDSARQGIFTYTDNSGVQRTVNIFDPAFGTGITGIDPTVASRFLSRIPQGNSVAAGDGLNTTGFTVIQNFNTEQTNYSGRIDYKINPLNTLNGSFRFVRQIVNRADIDNSFNVDPRATSGSDSPAFSLGLTSAFSSKFTNEIRGGRFSTNPAFLRLDPLQATTINLPLVTNPELPFENQGRTTTTYNIQDNATYTSGNHNLSFGGQYQNVNVFSFAAFSTVPTFSLGTGTATPSFVASQFPGGISSGQLATANGLLGLLGGIVTRGSQTFNVASQTSGFVPGAPGINEFAYNILGFYVSDQWRVRRDLTLNLGVRYERYSALEEVRGLALEPVISDPDNIAASILDPNGRFQFVGGNVGTPGRFYNPDNNNFAPVLSFAYAPKFADGIGGMLFGANTVIRGAYRFSFINDETIRAPDNALGGNRGLTLDSNVFDGNSTALNARLSNLPAIPTPVFTGDNRTFAQNNALAGNFGVVFAVDPNIKSPRVQEYSLGIQREIGFNTALEVRYVGTRSDNLIRGFDLNQTIIDSNGFLADFNRARSNLQNFGDARCSAAQATTRGCQQLVVFPNIAFGGLLTNGFILSRIRSGEVADLASIYVQNNLQGSVQFVPNQSAGVVDLLTNGSRFRYNALQVDLRRRFSQGLSLNSNYTFSKNLTNGVGTGQTRFEPFLDINQPELEYTRADFDQTHKFNLLASYDLPFGKGRPFLKDGILSTIFGGFNIGGILQIGSGAPVTITDSSGTLNRRGRSGRQTAVTNLTGDELQALVGVFRTPNGIFFINPTALGRNPDGSINTAAGGTGRGSNGLDTNFDGQVFFNNSPGTTSSLGRALFNGPTTYNLDMTIIKRFVFSVSDNRNLTFQLQADFFNVFNRANFTSGGQFLSINSTNFGRILGTATDQRITQLAFRVEF
ncbi:MAG: carboxypeptidase-like regulatory domain-containing protein [Acidobacteriota bacterium]|nr:carboxypeptidase-like regulatory domain-containing protein [Acidobacteriota bacterium]